MRKPREGSVIDIYHIIMRGVAEMNVFECEADKEKFLSLLKRYCEKLGIMLISYILLDSHIHLQVKAREGVSYSSLVHRLCISYVQHYFNPRYKRKGSLFQSRFISEAMEDEGEVKEMVRSMLTDEEGEVKRGYSSYDESMGIYEGKPKSLIDKDEFISHFPNRKNFIELIESKAPRRLCKEDYPMDSGEVSEYIRKEGKLNHCFEFSKMGEEEQRKIILPLIGNSVSWVMISKVTHMSVYRLKKVALGK